MQSISENDLECLPSTGVNTPETMSPNSGFGEVQLPQGRFQARSDICVGGDSGTIGGKSQWSPELSTTWT